ncbi:Radial spoke head protein 4 A [Gonapodya sp. JEL0774]|nr:Radial spoke head protein 4 A [Gonapodya sp. JEL0774]
MDPDFKADAQPVPPSSSNPSSKTGSKTGSASALPPLPAPSDTSVDPSPTPSPQPQAQPPAQPAPLSKPSSRRASQSQLAKPPSPESHPQTTHSQERPGSTGSALLPEDSELALARAFLQQSSDVTGVNLYDHLSNVILRVLEQRPKNAAGPKRNIFEQLSGEVKRSRFPAEDSSAPGAFRTAKDLLQLVELAKAQIKTIQNIGSNRTTDGQPKEEEGVGEIPDMVDLVNMFEWAGVAPLTPTDTYILTLSLRHLTSTKSLKSVRLFGRIHTLSSHSYIIAECEPSNPPGEVDPNAPVADDPNDPVAGFAVDAELAKERAEREALVDKLFEEPVEGLPEDQMKLLPKPKKKGVGEVPPERGVGVNKYVYYVCRFAGDSWIRLPDAHPEKLQTARKITKYFSGDLNKKIVTYPPIECSEAQYLRCQIARIAAGTVLSPQGYYMFDPEEEAGLEDGAHPTTIIVNPEYRTPPPGELQVASSWVHHVPYILPQGRVNWEAPPKTPSKETTEGKDGEEEGEEDEGGSEGGDDGSGGAQGKESGPAVLTAVAEDGEIAAGVPAFSIRMCSTFHTVKYSPIHLASNRWPGAHTIAYQDRFANVYVGDGVKAITNTHGYHIPEGLPECAKEWVDKDKKEEEEEEKDKEDLSVEGEGKAKVNLGVLVEQVEPTLEQEKAAEEDKAAKDAEKEEAEAEGKEEEE